MTTMKAVSHVADGSAAKAWAGAVMTALMAGLLSAIDVLADGQVTAVEWLHIVVAALGAFSTAFGVIYLVPNAPTAQEYPEFQEFDHAPH